MPFHAVFDGSGENLTVWNIFLAIAIDESSTVDAQAQIGLLADHPHLFFAFSHSTIRCCWADTCFQ